MVDSAHFMPVSGKSAMCLQPRTDTPTLDIGKKFYYASTYWKSTTHYTVFTF